MILDRANIEAGLACLIHEVGNASAAASSRENTTHRSMMIEVTIFQTKQGLNDNEVFTNNPPSPKNTNARSPNLNTLKIYSNDRRSISTNANKIYSALIANAQAATRANAQTPLNPNGRGLRIQEISEMVGMEVSDVVVAGDELLEGGWILRGL